jgi:hypothetical protein
LHPVFVTDVGIISANYRVNTGNTPATAKVSTNHDTWLQQFFEIANNFSKIIDENGGPLVVYHDTDKRIK